MHAHTGLEDTQVDVPGDAQPSLQSGAKVEVQVEATSDVQID